MLIRIVKMKFREDEVQSFLKIFRNTKDKIRNFDGCRGLNLLRDKHDPNCFFTYSRWDEESSLENYRNSDLFRSTWSQTKLLFRDKPKAWSCDIEDAVEPENKNGNA